MMKEKDIELAPVANAPSAPQVPLEDGRPTRLADADALLALVERCEREEPSRELDAAIENALAGGSARDLAYILTDIETTTKPPRYTTSLDAAVSLVPEGMGWLVRHIPRVMPSAAVWQGWIGDGHDGRGKTPALCLCAAALRARANSASDAGKARDQIAHATES